MSEEEIRKECADSGHHGSENPKMLGQACVPCIEYDNRRLRAENEDLKNHLGMMTADAPTTVLLHRAEAAEAKVAAQSALIIELGEKLNATKLREEGLETEVAALTNELAGWKSEAIRLQNVEADLISLYAEAAVVEKERDHFRGTYIHPDDFLREAKKAADQNLKIIELMADKEALRRERDTSKREVLSQMKTYESQVAALTNELTVSRKNCTEAVRLGVLHIEKQHAAERERDRLVETWNADHEGIVEQNASLTPAPEPKPAEKVEPDLDDECGCGHRYGDHSNGVHGPCVVEGPSCSCKKFISPSPEPKPAEKCEGCGGDGRLSDGSCGDIDCCGAGDGYFPCPLCTPEGGSRD